MKNYYNEIREIALDVESSSKVREYEENSERVKAYFNIGKLIVEAQGGKVRAKYGNELIKKWSIKLSEEFGKGYDYSNLKRFRQFYLEFQKSGSLCHQLMWSHIRYLLPIKNENERNYYINQIILNNLSVRELRREIKNKAYERLSYADKENIKLINKNDNNLTMKDMIKDPILINTKENITQLEEKSLHKMIINMLEDRFLELGVGFALVGHEYKIKIDNKTYKIDLLFFNYEINSFVVVEVKTREFKPEDIGQLNLYINYIDKKIKKNHHNKTIGILIVKKKNKLVIEYITNKDNLYLTTYKLITCL